MPLVGANIYLISLFGDVLKFNYCDITYPKEVDSVISGAIEYCCGFITLEVVPFLRVP